MSDVRATYRRARGRIGWVWICYSHLRPIRRRYLSRPWRAMSSVAAEAKCRQGLRSHLLACHPGMLED